MSIVSGTIISSNCLIDYDDIVQRVVGSYSNKYIQIKALESVYLTLNVIPKNRFVITPSFQFSQLCKPMFQAKEYRGKKKKKKSDYKFQQLII